MDKKTFISKFCYDVFQISLFTFVIFSIIEYIKKGLITDYLDLNVIILICLISGIISVILKKYDSRS